MPLFPLPPDTPLGGGAVPVNVPADVLAEFPRPHKNNPAAPVRDGFCAGFCESLRAYQSASEYAAAQCDPLRAVGEYLRSIAEEKEVVPIANEADDDLRARLFKAPSIVTPNAILQAVNDLLAPYTDILAEGCEPEMDGWYVHDSSPSVWDSFIGSIPYYPDRLYFDDLATNGVYIPQNMPDRCIVSNGYPRNFLIRIPVLEATKDLFAFSDFMFIGDGTDAGGTESNGTVATSVFGDSLTEDEIYAAIIGAVQKIKGQGMSWELIADPNLT